MSDVAIGVYATGGSAGLEDTLACLRDTVPDSVFREVFLATGSGNSNQFGFGTCLRQLASRNQGSTYIVMESGCQPMPGWLDGMMAVFRSVPSCALVGPSTNRASGAQGAFRSLPENPVANAIAAKLRFGSAYRTLKRHEYLEDFCVGIRGSLLNTEFASRATVNNWTREYSKLASDASHPSLWACGAYVHRSSTVANQPLRGHLQEQSTEDEIRVETQTASISSAPIVGISVQNSSNTQSSEEDPPLASCIMPTYNRRAFVPRAVRSFLCQDYPNRELIVVDDGTDPVEDLLPTDERVRYFRLNKRQNVGAKRNFACQQALGKIVLHWDDDEWYSSSRIRSQVNALRQSKARVSGTSVAFFYNENSERAFRYSFGGPAAGWMGALAYPLSVWKERPFDAVPIAEDVRFISRVAVNLRLDLRDPSLYIASIHNSNTSPKVTTGSYWRAEPIESLRSFPGFAPIASFAQPEMAGSR